MGILPLTLVRATSSMFSTLTFLSVVSLAVSQNLQCPTGVTAPTDFYIIGASGGDSTVECENTAAATTKGLQSGMNAVELDISVSQDNVVFLWNDPNPLDPVAQARRFNSFLETLNIETNSVNYFQNYFSSGLFVAGLCNPRFNTHLGSRDMVFSLIRQNYFYVNASGVDQGATIPTLWEWMDAFAANTELQLIILDLKIVDIGLTDYLVNHIMTKAVALGATSKIRIVSSDYSMAAALQTSLSRAGYDINIASRVFGGTAGAVHLGSNENFNAVDEAKTECYGLANVGQTVSSNGWRQYQNIVSRMVTKRDEVVTDGGNYIPVLGWRINQIEKITWMICAGVDGIYTDNIGEVKSLKTIQANGDIQCCMEDKVTPCLPPYYPRLVGQGCSSMGLTYYDLTTEACPIVGIDFLYTGTKLTCRQLKFCQV